jgi:UDP-N-acetylmuramyl pentapeptide synthase
VPRPDSGSGVGSPFGDFEVPLLGAHNVRNGLAAIAVATEVGLSVKGIDEGLRASPGSSAGSRSSEELTA